MVEHSQRRTTCEPRVKQLTKLFFPPHLSTNGTFCFLVNSNRYEQIIVSSGSGIEIWNPPVQVSSSWFISAPVSVVNDS